MQRILPYILVMIRAVIYGSSVLFTSNLLSNTGVFDVLSLRFMLSALFFLLFKFLGIIKINLKNKNLKLLCLTAFFEPGAYFIFETLGIKDTSNILAGILLSLSPVIIIILETVFLREKTSFFQKFCLLIRIMGGIIVVAYSSDAGTNTVMGIIFMIFAMVSGAAFLISSRKSAESFSPVEITFFTTIFGAVLFNIINIYLHISSHSLHTYFEPLLNAHNVYGLIFLSLFSSVIATVMGNYCCGKMQVSKMSALSGVSTIVTITIGVVFNHESLHSYHIIGTIMILTGALCMNLIPSSKNTKI